MKELYKTSFWELLITQKQVIGALLMRETITRHGCDNTDFLWLFVEPLLITLITVLMWKFFKVDNISILNIAVFTIMGYPMMIVWRNVSNRAIGPISVNMSLSYHRNIRVLDTTFTRILLEIAGATIAQIAIMSVLIAVRWIEMPTDIFYMLLVWLLMAMFAIGLDLAICSVALHFESFDKIWGTVNFVMVPLSGVFFFVHNPPQQLQHYVLVLPMAHDTETFRADYFSSSVTTCGNPWSILLCNSVLLLLELAMVTKFSRGVEPR